MKTQLITLICASALIATASLRADQTNTPAAPVPPHHDAPRVIHLIPPAMIEKLALTDDQKQKVAAIEESFAKTQQEYYDAHKEEIDAAHKAMDAARKSMDEAMAGLQEQRKAAQEQIKSLLTPEQIQSVTNSNGRSR